MVDTISEKICKECGLKPIIVGYECNKGMGFNPYTNTCPIYVVNKCRYYGECYPESTMKPIYSYIDFELPENQIKLQKLLVDSGHTITLVKDWYSIGCGLNDFINDCYDTQHEMTGKTFLECVYNYISLWYEQRQVSYSLSNGKMSPPMDLSHTLTPEECVYTNGFELYKEDTIKVKELINKTNWFIPQK